MIYFIFTAVGIFFLRNVQTISAPSMEIHIRHISFQGTVHEIEDWVYLEVFIFVTVMLMLGLKDFVKQIVTASKNATV